MKQQTARVIVWTDDPEKAIYSLPLFTQVFIPPAEEGNFLTKFDARAKGVRPQPRRK